MVEKSHVRPHRKCQCGSKKKYRNCCGREKTVPFDQLPKESQDVMKKLIVESNIAEQYHKAHFGYAAPIVSCVFDGKRVVFMGGELMYCPDPDNNWEHPLDFLLSNLITILGDDWFSTQLKTPEAEQHEIIKWFLGSIPNLEIDAEEKWGKLNGKSLSLMHLAYDLFVMKNINNLPQRLIDRLKNIQNFNGARYELFMFATLVRAGFEIEYIDESTGKYGRVPECRAKHITSDEFISFEAKTRNVIGILGSKEGKRSKVRLYDKIKDAIEKNISEPYIIFVDSNLPEFDVFSDKEKLQKIRGEIHKITNSYNNSLPNLICITNIPFHYGRDDQLPSGSAYGYIIPHNPKIELKNKRIIDLIRESLQKYWYLPKEFDESKNYAKDAIKKINFPSSSPF